MRALRRPLGVGCALLAALWLMLGAAAPSAVHAQALQQVPVLDARVVDRTGTLSAAARAALEAKLAAFEAHSGPQIVVLMVATTQPEDIAAYAQRVADAWKIGRRNVGDGLLLVVARDDRRVRIEVAKALEGAVPDLAARQIIDRAMVPALRAGDYAGGIDAAIDALIARIQGEGLPAPDARPPAQHGLQLDELGIFLFVVVPVVGAVLTGLFGRRLGAVLTAGAAGGLGWWFTASLLAAAGAALVALVLVGLLGIGAAARRGSLPRGWSGGSPDGGWRGGGFGSGGGGFSSGGGGFSSGGGGDFGGGGASGRW